VDFVYVLQLCCAVLVFVVCLVSKIFSNAA
jgi:hypothetical protein